MSYDSEIFDRANIQNIREFLFHGVECTEFSEKSYKQRIEEHLKPAIAIIESKFNDVDEN